MTRHQDKAAKWDRMSEKELEQYLEAEAMIDAMLKVSQAKPLPKTGRHPTDEDYVQWIIGGGAATDSWD